MSEFDPTKLTDIIGDDNIPQTFAPTINSPPLHIKENEQIDICKVYNNMAELVSSGNRILSIAENALNGDPTIEGGIAGAATLLNAVRDTVSEFNKLYLQNLKFEQMKQFEDIKQKNREKLLIMKLKNNLQENSIDTVSYCQEEVVKQLSSN